MLNKCKTLLNLLLKNPRSIPEIYNASKYRTELEKYYSSIKKKKIIWHICTPKSASTFLMKYFINIESQNKKLIKNVKMFRSGKNRNNIIDLNFFSKQLDNNKINITQHAHSLPTDDLIKCFSKKHKIIIQSRNILDTIVSLKDGMARSKKKFWLPMAEEYWNNKNIDHYKDLIFNYLPFHINFLNSWLWYSKNSDLDISFIKYDDIINDNNQSVIIEKFFSKFNVDINLDNIPLVEKSLHNNFNIGLKGRGKKLIPKKYLEEIKDKLLINDYFGFNLLDYLDED